MATEDDDFSVGIKGHLDAATNSGGLSLATRSRFIAALDRLLGGFFDLPAAWLDARAERIRVDSTLRNQIAQSYTDRVKVAISEGRVEDARLLAVQAPGQIREIERTANLAAVIREASERVTEGDTEGPSPESENAHVDDDWLNRFRHFASEASSNEMRTLWARVLAGEVKKPGQFGAAALRFIFELDLEMSNRCERISARVLRGGIYPDDQEQTGQFFMDALTLQAEGLLTGVGGTVNGKMEFNSEGRLIIGTPDCFLDMEGTPNKKLSLGIWVVTPLGLQIFSLLPAPKVDQNLKLLASRIDQSDVKSLKLLKLGGPAPNGGRHILFQEELKKAGHQPS